MTSLVSANWWRLPVALQQRDQWCIAGPDKSPYLQGQNGLYRASSTQGPWHSFETACRLAGHYGVNIGFILTKEDPFTCIDMDVKDVYSRNRKGEPFTEHELTTNQQLEQFQGTVAFAASYTELSTSGKGLHTWVLGNIGEGKRSKGIEVYSQERFIVCTGQPVSEVVYHRLNGVVIPIIREQRQLPIADGTEILNALSANFTERKSIELVEVDATKTDDEIWRLATQANNKDKFIALCEGNWKNYSFPSQSEADLALLSMFTFYSKSNEQCRRMFKQTAMYRENKGDRYIDRTLKTIRGRQAGEQAASNAGAQLAASLLARFEQDREQGTGGDPASPVRQHSDFQEVEDLAVHAPAIAGSAEVRQALMQIDQAQFTKAAPNNVVDYVPPEVDGLEWPPGLTGAVAGFVYQSAPRPVKEVAIVAALGLMAGILGKVYNVGQTGLNLYVILIARSAIGKEAMHSGIGHILRSDAGMALRPFVDFNDYVSGPALVKGVSGNPSIVNISGEWGRKLKRMADDQRDGPMTQLRTAMTNLYQKSGAASVAGGLSYSNKEQNIDAVSAVSYSMIGETTPGTFYDSLTLGMMEDGFLSRFNIIEYDGERPPENKDQVFEVPPRVAETLKMIAGHVQRQVRDPTCIQVDITPEAKEMLDAFNVKCDNEIRNAHDDETIRQMWNRAHLKAIRVAGVLAAADNHISPAIQKEHAQWALKLIEKDVASMERKVKGGDVGSDDSSRVKKLHSVLVDYLKGNVSKGYKVDERMIRDGIVPRKFLAARVGQASAYRNHRLGTSAALDHTLRTAIDSGSIMEVDKTKAIELYNYHGRCFRILEID